MIDRKEFLTRFIRYLLLGILGITAVFLGSKTVTGTDCSACPGKGICKGETDCSTWIPDEYGRSE